MRMPVTVAHLVCSTGFYGAERWILTLARALDPARVRLLPVVVGSGEGADLVRQTFAAARCPAVQIAHGAKISVAAIRALRVLIRNRGVRVVHTHGFKADALGYLAARGAGVALVSTPHGWSADEGWRIALYEAVGRAFMKRCQRVYPLSGSLEADLLTRGFRRDRVRLVANAVDDEPLRPIFAEREAAGPRLRGMVLFVGRLIPAKGVFELVEGYARAALHGRPELRLVGDGPARPALQRRAAELGVGARVVFSGYVSDVREWLRRADALVLPSYSEGLPRVLMEAAAAGVPIVASDIAGVRQLIADDVNGLLVPRRDPGALAAALERLLADPALRRRLAGAARRTIDERHTAARQARAFEAEYLSLCGAAA